MVLIGVSQTGRQEHQADFQLWKPAQVLLRALRDFNLGKLTADDTGIFTGLLDDLFPKVAEKVPRARDIPFEAKVRPCICLCSCCAD